MKVPYSDSIKGLSYSLKDEGVYGFSARFRSTALNNATPDNCTQDNSFKIRRGSSIDKSPVEAGESTMTFKDVYVQSKAASGADGAASAYPLIYGPGLLVGGNYYVQWGAEKTMHCTQPDGSSPEPKDAESVALDSIAKALSRLREE